MNKLTILVLTLWTLTISAQSITINSMIWNSSDSSTTVNFTTSLITSVTNWEYSTDSGKSWTTLNPVSTSLTTLQIKGLGGKNSLVLKTIGANPSGTFTSNTFVTPTNLPVTWAGFDVYKSNNSNVLIWKTASELRSDYFVPQWSLNGDKWDSLGRVEAKIISDVLNTYKFEHINLPNTDKLIYYRIKQVDLDGTFDYSIITYAKSTLSINESNESKFKILTNQNNIYISTKKTTKVNIFDLNGKVKQNLSNEYINLKSGIYIIEIEGVFTKIAIN